jgi:hypothetical protein
MRLTGEGEGDASLGALPSLMPEDIAIIRQLRLQKKALCFLARNIPVPEDLLSQIGTLTQV